MKVINKFRAFREWYDVDERLSKAASRGSKRRDALAGSHGKPFSAFVGKQPELVQICLTKVSGILAQTLEPIKTADDYIGKVRGQLNGLKLLNEDIRSKRKETQAMRDRAQKSRKKADGAQAKLGQSRAQNPPSAEIPRLEEEYQKTVSQKQSDQDALEKREDQFKTEVREYKKQLFLSVLTALDEFASAKVTSAEGLSSIGPQLQQAGGEFPDFEDAGLDAIQQQLEALQADALE
jgi:hypothetical protein